MTEAFDVFLAPDALAINRARLDHLASLGLDLAGKRVLEVGAGIGLLSHFFEVRGCALLSTDGAASNILEMRRRFPHRDCAVLDIDAPCDLTALGRFDVIFCYGTLYHLANPDRALQQLAAVCAGQILLETVVLPGEASELQLVREPLIANQAIAGVGCRPTRGWVMEALRRHFGHAYLTLTQPDFPDYVVDWRVIEHSGNLRAVFVGAHAALQNAALTETAPDRQTASVARASRPARAVWIDVGAHSGEHSIAWAREDPDIVVHAFEPLPELAAALAEHAPSNYVVHAKAISLHDGTAPFHVNRFDAASSLAAMDEQVRAGWTDGELLEETAIMTVQTTRLDSFLNEIGASRVEFLKIDAQGGDFDVVRSLGARIGDVRRIQLEVDLGERPLYVAAPPRAHVVEWMEGHGFELVGAEPQSHGQEENLTFKRPDWPLDALPERAAAARLYDFTDAVIERGEAHFDGETLRVTTGSEQWSYAVVVPLRIDFELAQRRAKLKLRAEVAAGRAEIGVLDPDGTRFLASRIVAPGDGGQVSLDLPRSTALGALVIRNAGEEGVARLTVQLVDLALAGAQEQTAQPVPDGPPYDERKDFETIPPGWEHPFAKLRQKWSEIPASYEERRDNASLLELSDADLLAYWERSTAEQTQGDGYAIRGWYHDLYRDVVPGKRILDVGCGIGTSSISFAQMGAELFFVDIAEGNVRLVERLCALKGISARFLYIEDYASFDALPQDFDIVMAIGSLINAPHGVTKREIDRLKRCLKPGGRWLHLAYPRARWEREGRAPFAKWGEMTDGPRTPWMVYQDRAELEALFAPSKIRFNFDCEWRGSEFNWFDIELVEH